MEQKLMMAEGVFDTLECNEWNPKAKTCTIRKGRRDIQLGDIVFESIETQRTKKAWVDRVIYCWLCDVPEEYIHNDGFEDAKDMLEQMRTYYPDMEMNTEVTVIEFDTQYAI